MNTIQTFNFEGAPIRSEVLNGEPWFVASDVARILGYRDAANLTRRLDDEDRGTRSVSTPSGQQQMTVISEPGLFAAILGSQVPGARNFKRWVTHDVLPHIRQTGKYEMGKELTGAELMARALVEAHSTLESYQARVKELEPLAASWERLASASGDYSVRDAAQVLCRDGGIQIGQNRLFRHLREAARPWLDKNSRPYQWAVDQGLVSEKVSSFSFRRTNGEEQLAPPQVRVTAKGLQRLHKELTAGTEMVRV